MVTNFLWGLNNNGFLSPAPTTATGNTATSTTISSLSPAVNLIQGQMIAGSGVPSADVVAGNYSSATSITIKTATTSSLTGTTLTFHGFPTLISGESSALTNGSGAVTSSYWNTTGVFAYTDLQQALLGGIFFMSGGAFTPTAGGILAGWFLPSIGDNATFETAFVTPSTTLMAVSRSPDFIIPLDAAAYAAGYVRYCNGLIEGLPPPTTCKVIVQNLSGVTMPSTWLIGCGPVAPQY